jgi:imidazoleglycerol-phosphate dehydratase/histidinol-phosphatase
MQQKILFIDRDGTIIIEPEDKQIDSYAKLALIKDVIPALLKLKAAGYVFVMVSNQDGLGTPSLPEEDFIKPHQLLLDILTSQGIEFDSIRICPHKAIDGCDCRKPKLGLVLDYLVEQKIDRAHSFVIGDRETDVELAQNMGIRGLRLSDDLDWNGVVKQILASDRIAEITRKTKETEVKVRVDLDQQDEVKVRTGLGFFDHMLEQLAKHGGFNLEVDVQGDLEIDDHHTVEDTALTLGEALRKALGDKRGIGRFGFVLPMDEAQAQVAIDLSGRAYFDFKGEFSREQVGDLATELVPHFFRSFAEGLKATLHIEVTGENNHHMIEATFKALGRALRQAFAKNGDSLPSTKGVL